MRYRIWDEKTSKIIEASSMGDAFYSSRDEFPGDFEIERLDNWDCDPVDQNHDIKRFINWDNKYNHTK
ncbi:hypothetical protein CMI47_04100 [Candidatus Pacearchaeota archaeon]|jgi:hypothetical protein|nr:hypothetical protein [Candidatus Pacearchaeota archaeon]|tara:strand:- start:512 stop:715 length:204 start_codon:yes stop_codon:yes gene_type:complete